MRRIATPLGVLLLALSAFALAGIATGAGWIGPDRLPGSTGAAASWGPVVAPSADQSSVAGSTAVPSGAPGPSPSLRPSSPYLPSPLDQAGVRERLQAALDGGRVALAAPGVVASVLFPDGHQWTGTAGVADLASGRTLAPATPFAIASVSKTFLAAEILALVGEGRLALDDAAATLIPGTIVGGRPLDARITVRQLLDHTSGLRDYLVDRALDRAVRADPTHAWTPDEALAYVGPPVAAPGAGYHYANTNYVLLGRIAESLTGRSLAAEYRVRFLDPLGLRATFYQAVEPAPGELATAYRYTSGALNATPVDVTDGTPIRPFTAITTAAGAAGSMASSAPDLARWARALYSGVALDPDLVRLMVDDASSTAYLEPGASYGLGVQVLTIDGRIAYGHSGRLVGARSVVRWFPAEGIAIAIVTNESRFDPTSILRDLLAIVAPESVAASSRPD